MRKFLATLAFLLWPALGWAANCTITGKVYNPDGTPVANGQVHFNSMVQQTLQGGATVPPTQVSTGTGADGTIAPIGIVQGLQGQFVFCSPAQGGCGNPTPVLIPIASTADISSILIGIQLSSGGNVVASSLNVTGNSTMGGTLGVTGATTLSSTLTVTGATATGALTVTGNASVSGTLSAGATTMPSLTLTNNTSSLVTFPSGSITSVGGVQYVTGAHYNGTNWIADNATPLYFGQIPGSTMQYWGVDTGLTVGATFTPTPRLSLTNTYLNAEFDYNGGSILQVANYSAGTGALAYTRASNGTNVVDVGIWGTGYTASGFASPGRAYLAANGANGLLIEATGSGSNADVFLLANGNQVLLLGNNHFGTQRSGTAAPTAGTCGTGTGTVFTNSSDNAGYVQFNGTGATCSVNFALAWAQAPVCTCSPQSTPAGCAISSSASGIGMSFTTNIPSGQYVQWICQSAVP